MLGEALDQDRPRALQGLRRGGDALVLVDEGCRLPARISAGIGEERVGQRLKAGFAGDLGLGAALQLVGQVEVSRRALVAVALICARSSSVSLPCSRMLAIRPSAGPTVRVGSAGARRGCAAGRRRGSGRLLAIAGAERDRGAADDRLQMRARELSYLQLASRMNFSPRPLLGKVVWRVWRRVFLRPPRRRHTGCHTWRAAPNALLCKVSHLSPLSRAKNWRRVEIVTQGSG